VRKNEIHPSFENNSERSRRPANWRKIKTAKRGLALANDQQYSTLKKKLIRKKVHFAFIHRQCYGTRIPNHVFRTKKLFFFGTKMLMPNVELKLPPLFGAILAFLDPGSCFGSVQFSWKSNSLS
jgi:hypothetical protein